MDLIRDRATTFPEVKNKEKLSRMRVWHCKYKTLQPIAEFHNLEELVVATFPDKTLRPIVSLRKLRYLRIVHMPKIASLHELSELEGLESLALETSPSWDASRRCTIVESLEPIAAITGLKHLELFGVCPPDKSLAALEKLKTLQSARFSQYPQTEVERFYRNTGVINEYIPRSSFGA